MNLNSIKNALFATMHGMTPEEYELQKARDNLKSLTDNFLDQHPEYLRGRFAEGKPANGSEYLKTKQTKTAAVSKSTNVYKMLGADAGKFQPQDIDPEALERAKAACRKLVADNPERYGNIINQGGE